MDCCTSFDECFTSPLFTFEVLEDRPETIEQRSSTSLSSDSIKFEVAVPSMIIGGLSPELHALVTSPMKEANERRVSFVGFGTRRETFLKVCEYAHTGDYNFQRKYLSQEHESLGKSTSTGQKRDHDSIDASHYPSSSKRLKTQCSESDMHEDVIVDSIPMLDPERVGLVLSEAEILLDHARVYVFATQWNIRPLRKLSLDKFRNLWSDLSTDIFDIAPEKVIDIAKFLFQDDPVTGLPSTEENDKMRQWLVHLILHDPNHPIIRYPFLTLIREGGAFAESVVKGTSAAYIDRIEMNETSKRKRHHRSSSKPRTRRG